MSVAPDIADHESAARTVQFNCGYSYCIVLRSDAQHNKLLQDLLSRPDSAVVARDGGLISNLNVWENIVLPIDYYSRSAGKDLESKVICMFGECGLLDELEVYDLLVKLPNELSLYKKRLVGFVRAILMEPELMVYDMLYDGLPQDDVERVARFDPLFHRYFPFRTSVLLSFDERKIIGGACQFTIHA